MEKVGNPEKNNQIEEGIILGEKYDCKYGYYQLHNNGSLAYMDPLLIDYSLLISSSSSPQAKEELHKFKSALSSWGCFQLVNHGMPRSFLEEVKEVSKKFFEVAMEEKMKYKMLPGGTNGFVPGTTVDSNNNKIRDWNEGLALTLFPEDRRQLNFWPHIPIHFKKVLDEYTTRLTAIFDVLFKLVFKSLEVDEKKFENEYGKNKEINTRFNYYQKCPDFEQVLGLKPHADFSALTLLLQDEEGLQVLKDHQWFIVPVIPHALFLNLGDPIEIMSNGIFKSAVHRVVTNTDKERVSIAAFWDSDRDREIGPLDELVIADHPQVYQRTSLKDYASTFFNYYESGQRSINDLRI